MKPFRFFVVCCASAAALAQNATNPKPAASDSVSPLLQTTLLGDAQAVETQLNGGADPNQSGPGGTTALMWAIPDIQKVRVLLAHGANVNAQSETGRTPLLVAASYPRTIPVLQLLLDRGADLRAQDRGGATALSLAARSSDVEVVRFLADRGLDPKALSAGAVRTATLRHDPATTEYLMSRGVPLPPDILITAATWQPSATISRWIDSGADINANNSAQYSRTALLTAVTSEGAGPETLKLLLDHGANPNAAMTEGDAPLDWAIYKSDRAKIDILQKYGAKRGKSPRQEEIAAPPKNANVDARIAITRSVARLMDASPGFKDKTSCISCHHNAMPAMAAAAAKKKHIDVNAERSRKNLDDVFTFFQSNVARMITGDPAVGGEALTAGYSAMALAAEGHPLDTVTAAMMHWLLARQMPDGSWLGNGINRPPSEYSTISHTAIAVGGLRSYPLPARKDAMRESLNRARSFLVSSKATSAEERAMRLMGLVWSEAPQRAIADAIRDVRSHQEANGGWSQFGRTEPDAYATGMSLYALHTANVPVTDPAYRKGLAFLYATQYPDGSWLVKTHSFPVQRYFESGFPFGRHQWISSAGTSWATLAIAATLN